MTKHRAVRTDAKSVAELKLLGTYRADRHGKIQPPVEYRERVVPQDHITKDITQVDREQIFNWFADILHEQGMTQAVDSVLLSQLVEAHAIYIKALNIVHIDPEAKMGKRPAISVAFEAAREVRTLMSEFRLMPSSRTIRLKDSTEVPDDPVAAFLNAKVVSSD